MIIDNYKRVHTYLRISLTDNCNLRCFYCMPEEHYEFTPMARLMQPDEIEAIAKIFVNEGVNKIRLTGGEPFVRKDAGDIILRLSKLPVKLTLTTNATRTHHFIDILEKANIHSLNISLDTLHADRFQLITKRDLFKQVFDNIQLLIDKKFKVKINVVVMKGINDDEIVDFIEWTKHSDIEVRFIEFMPFDSNHWTSGKVFTLKEMMTVIEKKYTVVRLENDVHDTSKKYKIENHLGTFAIISTMSAPFCSGCNRIRLTADGKIKNCLFSESETDLLTPFRNGEDILPLINQNIRSKAKELGGQFTKDFEKIHSEDLHNRSMIAIGG